MIFYICLILAMIVTVSGIVGSVRGVNLFGRVESPVHVMLAVSLINTCILYIPWFIYSWQTESGDFKNSLLIVPFMIVRLMQTVSMDADYEAAIQIAYLAQVSGVSERFLQFYSILLSYVSVLVPLSGILTIAGFFGNRIGYRGAIGRLSGRTRIYVFNGTGERNMGLAESIFESERKAARKCSFLFCNVHEDPGVTVKRQIRKMKGWYAAEYPSLLMRIVTYRRNRRIHFFLLEDEEKNFNDVMGILRAAESLSGGKEHWPEADRVRISMLLESEQLDRILDSQDKHGIFVRIMNTESMCSQELFKRWPLFSGLSDSQKSINLLIIGKGGVAAKALQSALWMGRLAKAALKIAYIGEDAEELRNRLYMTCPALFDPRLSGGIEYDLSFDNIVTRAQLTKHSGKLSEADYVLIACGDDDTNIRTAIWTRTWIARQRPLDAEQPFIAVCIRDNDHAVQADHLYIQDSRETYGFHIFGTDSRLFTAENILYSRLDRILYRIQLSYCMDDPDEEPSEQQKNEAWMQLNRSVYNFRSSEANAQYIVNRLFDAGALEECLRRDEAAADITGRPLSGSEQAKYWANAVRAAETSGDRSRLDEILAVYEEKIADRQTVDLLAKAEHARWVTYMAVNGWIPLPAAELVMRKERRISGHKDYLRLRHAAMVSWDELDEISAIVSDGRDIERFKNADRKTVKDVGRYLK